MVIFGFVSWLAGFVAGAFTIIAMALIIGTKNNQDKDK